MAEQRPRPPMGPHEAAAWPQNSTQASTRLRDAAMLNKLQFRDDEISILHVSSAYGTFAVTTWRIMSLPTRHPVYIVGINHCQTLMDTANGYLDELFTRHLKPRTDMKFRNIDAFSFGTQANLNSTQALFPRSTSTIMALGVFNNVGDDATQQASRDLAALLAPGGRIIINIQYQPQYWSATHFIPSTSKPAHLISVINLAPYQFTQAATEQVRMHCQRIPSTSSTGMPVAIDDVECEWINRI